jgi:HEAT repeat protein
VLDELAASSPPALLPALIEGAGLHGQASVLERLLGRLDQLDDQTAVSFAHTVDRIGSPEAEPGLLSLLGRASDAVRTAAAGALARVGTVRAVEPLLALTSGLLTAPSLKRAAREAVERIQGRLGDAEAGRLSLVVPAEEAGSLSLAGAEPEPAGELSLLEREPAPPEPEISN